MPGPGKPTAHQMPQMNKKGANNSLPKDVPLDYLEAGSGGTKSLTPNSQSKTPHPLKR